MHGMLGMIDRCRAVADDGFHLQMDTTSVSVCRHSIFTIVTRKDFDRQADIFQL
jgi:hypothetical protein